MLTRWNPLINCINLALSTMHRIVQKGLYKKKGRGAKPKRDVEKYAFLISLKEFDKRTLRGAEMHLSRLVCDERIDHSVIAYWENKKEMTSLVSQFISIAGAMLQKCLSSLFTFVDSTKFSSWYINEIEVTVCNKIAKQTVYPVGISFLRESVDAPVREAVPEGTGNLKADAWYDANKALGVMFEKGYTPIVCPNKNRIDGYWRRKARKIYRLEENRLAYRQRGRGESLFGSLTNEYGDRLKARNVNSMKTRIATRIFCYQIKLLIRLHEAILRVFVRHAHLFIRII